MQSSQTTLQRGVKEDRGEAYLVDDQGSYLPASADGQHDFGDGKMDPFEFAKEIQQNMVEDEEYIKVSGMGGIPEG